MWLVIGLYVVEWCLGEYCLGRIYMIVVFGDIFVIFGWVVVFVVFIIVFGIVVVLFFGGVLIIG